MIPFLEWYVQSNSSFECHDLPIIKELADRLANEGVTGVDSVCLFPLHKPFHWRVMNNHWLVSQHTIAYFELEWFDHQALYIVFLRKLHFGNQIAHDLIQSLVQSPQNGETGRSLSQLQDAIASIRSAGHGRLEDSKDSKGQGNSSQRYELSKVGKRRISLNQFLFGWHQKNSEDQTSKTWDFVNVHHASNLQNYQKTKVIGSGLGMLKRASNPSQPIEDHPLTDTYDRGPSTLAMSFSSERNFCPPLRLFFS